MRKIVLLLALTLGLLQLDVAYAQSAIVETPQEKKMNNKFSYTGNDEWRMSAGTYVNSNNRHSLYVAALWQPLEYKSDDVTLKTGVQVAVISNYLKQAITPTLLPAISIETKHVGADIFLVPKFPSVSAAVLLSFKVRF